MQRKQMTLFDVTCQVKLDQWLILSTCTNYISFPSFLIFLFPKSMLKKKLVISDDLNPL